MKVELKCGDKITVPEGCKAIVKGESVEIEKAQKFKDGDVLVVVIDDATYPFIFFKASEERCWYHIMLRPNGGISRTWFFDISKLAYTRHATEEVKRQLFDKMKEKGWLWNAEKKCVELNRWRAEKGKAYCRMGLGGGVFYEIDRRTNADNVFYDTLNYFHTEEQTREAIKRVQEALRQYHEEIGE